MGRSIAEQFERIVTSDDPGKRREAAECIATECNRNPESIRDADGLLRALAATSGTTREIISGAIYDLGIANRPAVEPIAGRLVSFLAEHDCSDRVRIDLCRAIGDGIASDPDRFSRGRTDELVAMLDDENEWVRHSVAWALELLAFAQQTTLGRYRDDVEAHVTDPHPPAAKHCCRALAHFERGTADLAGTPVVADLEAQLDATEASLRTAASLALGAIGSRSAIEALQSRAAIENDDAVATDLQHACREALFPDSSDAATDTEGGTADVAVDEWVSIANGRIPLRTGRLRGVVTDRRTDVDGGVQLTLTVTNPYEGYSVELSKHPDIWTATYADRRKSDALDFPVGRLDLVDSDRVALLYALEGERLDVTIEGRSYELEVVDVESSAADRRVVGADRKGHEIEFRPCSPNPLLARFRNGRCFDATSISLRPPKA